jgi:hypothetical protein
VKIHREEALELARASQKVWVAQRGKWLQFDAQNPGSDDEIAKVILGRSGTLRAPAFRAGDVFMVGFSPEAYGALFGDAESS